jgi:formylmethanofuran dehydrogenase subunit B
MIETAQAGLPDRSASVNGAPVSIMEATQAAASLLAGSRSAVIAGMGTDIAGARASIALARAIGASIDHMDADAVFADLEVMRRTGWIVTTSLQTRARADTVLLVGDGLVEVWPGMIERLGLQAAPALGGGQRRVFRLCAGSIAIGDPVAAASFSHVSPSPHAGPSAGATSSDHRASPDRATSRQPEMPRGESAGNETILPTLAALRAIAAGRATSLDEAAAAPLHRLAAALSEARFGVAIWSAAALGTLAVEMLVGLIDDLNKKTRFAGLPLVPPNGAEGVTHAASWATGFPVRTGFAGHAPLHDPWRFDAQRMIASGEADAAVWISAFSSVSPPWDDAVPTVALVPSGTVFRTPPLVVFEVGCPGRDHDAMLFDPALGGIAFAAASVPRASASVADTVAAITAALPSC